ncbi:MAG: hypothetical protein A4E48_02307 [Methanosaeta sp. PtaU1.Bin060]|jgi:hypothetical protein|nr:MAG: hypothetical protein A4E48_02307 [Methanosaeta sp. PtaU1.Bin060]
MTSLKITDIRKSLCDSGFDLVTAIVLSRNGNGANEVLSPKSCRGLLVLESATAKEELPSIGVRYGDQFIRIRAKQDHGLHVGDEIQFQ